MLRQSLIYTLAIILFATAVIAAALGAGSNQGLTELYLLRKLESGMTPAQVQTALDLEFVGDVLPEESQQRVTVAVPGFGAFLWPQRRVELVFQANKLNRIDITTRYRRRELHFTLTPDG